MFPQMREQNSVFGFETGFNRDSKSNGNLQFRAASENNAEQSFKDMDIDQGGAV